MSAAETADEDAAGFEAIVQVDAIETFFETINTLVDECRIHCTDDGLEVRAVDPANVAMVSADLDLEAFESYRGVGGILGVNVDRILDVLSIPDGEQLAQLARDPETNKLELTADGFEYTLGLIDPDSIRQEPDLPDLDLTSRVVVEGDELDRAITAAEVATASKRSGGGHIRFRSVGDTVEFHFEADGDTDGVDYTFDTESALDLDPGDADSTFSLEYMQDVTKPIGKDTRVAIRAGENQPAALAYSTVDGRLHLDYQIAPRVDST